MVTLVAAAAAGVAASIILGIRISLSISRPIKEIEQCAVRFSKADLSAHADYDSNNEIGVMARSLNSAFVSLQNIVNEISEILLHVAQGDVSFDNIRKFEGDF